MPPLILSKPFALARPAELDCSDNAQDCPGNAQPATSISSRRRRHRHQQRQCAENDVQDAFHKP